MGVLVNIWLCTSPTSHSLHFLRIPIDYIVGYLSPVLGICRLLRQFRKESIDSEEKSQNLKIGWSTWAAPRLNNWGPTCGPVHPTKSTKWRSTIYPPLMHWHQVVLPTNHWEGLAWPGFTARSLVSVLIYWQYRKRRILTKKRRRPQILTDELCPKALDNVICKLILLYNINCH